MSAIFEGYRIEVDPSLQLPRILIAFSKWLGSQPYPRLGDFNFIVREVSSELKNGSEDLKCSFIELGNNGTLCLKNDDSVVLLGPESGRRVEMAETVDEFLYELATGQTGISDFFGVKSADLETWLNSQNPAHVPKAEIDSSRIDLQLIFNAIGKSLDSSEVDQLLKHLGSKKRVIGGHIFLSRLGISLIFVNSSGLVLDCIVFTPETKGSKSYRGPLPHQLSFSDSEAQIHERLGPPQQTNEYKILHTKSEIWLIGDRRISVDYSLKQPEGVQAIFFGLIRG